MSSDDIYGRPKGPWAKIQGVLVGVLVGMLVLAFAVWGIEDVFSPNSSNAIVRVGDAEVGRTEFNDRFNQRMREYVAETGEGLTNQQAFDRGIPQQLVGQFRNDLAIEADADDLGIGVNNRDVRRYVEDIEAFRNDITGQFDENQFRNILASNRINQRDFEDDVVRALTQQQTLPAILGGIQAPRDYASRYNSFVNETRSLRVVRLDASAVDTIPPATDAEIAAYVEANRSAFTTPEYRRVLMLKIGPQDFMGNDPADPRFADAGEFPPEMFDIYVTDEQVRERFDLLVSAGRLGATETRDVTVVSAPDEAVAEQVALRIRAGEAPSAVAAALDLQAPATFTGIETDGLINPASSERAFELAEGEVGTAATDFGSVEVIRVDRIAEGSTPEFETERDRLQRELIEAEARKRINALQDPIDDALLDSNTLEGISETLNLPLQAYPLIDRTGTTPDGIRLSGFARLPGIAQEPGLINAIFAADADIESDILPTEDGGLAVFRVIDIIPPAERPLEEIRDSVSLALAAERLDRALVEAGRDIAERLRGGESIDALASARGLDVQDIAVQRASPPRTLSPEMLVGLLGGDVGDVARGPGPQPGTYDVGVLESVSNSAERLGGQLLAQIQQNLSEQVALDVSQAYTQAILADHEAQVYDDQLRAALALDPVEN